MRKTVSMQNLVKVSKGMLSRCIIRKSYYLPDENIANIKNSILFPSGLEFIRSVLLGFSRNREQRVHLLWGGCGVGKSHLGLVLANILGRNIEDEAYEDITQKVRTADPSLHKSIVDTRNAVRKILVTFPETLAGGDSRFRSPLLMSLNGALYQEGLEYLPKTEGTLVDIFSDTIEFLSGQTDCGGLAVIFDDFDHFLTLMDENPDNAEIKEFLEFGDLCKKSGFPIVFIGMCSKSPLEYFKSDISKSTELFDDIHYVNLFSKKATMETLIQTRILEHPDSQDREELIVHEDYEELEKMLTDMGLYQELSSQEMKEKVLWGAYPLHPLTLFCLPRICERLASHDRCFTTFFNDTSPGGLRYFIENIATVQPSGRLSLYTPDYLYSYFEKNIKEDTRYSSFVEAMEKSYVRVGDIPNSRRILRLITAMQIVDNLMLPTTEENIIRAIHMGEKENKQIRESLKKMVDKETLIFDEVRRAYEIPVEKKIVAFEDLFSDMKGRISATIDTFSYLNRHYRPKKLPAKHYNHRFFSQRSAYGKYVQTKDLLDMRKFECELDENYSGGAHYFKGDLLILYCPVKSHEEVAQIQEVLKSGAMHSPQLILAISKKLMDFQDEIIGLASFNMLMKLEPYMSEPGSTAELKSREEMKVYHKSLKEKLSKLDNAQDLRWYWQGKDLKESEMTGDLEGLTKIMREVFHKAPLLKYRTLFTRAPRKGLRKSVKTAVETILKNRMPLSLPDYTENEAEKIIKSSLVDKEVMEQVGEDSYGTRYEVRDLVPVSSPFHDLWARLQENLRPQGLEKRKVEPGSIIRDFMKQPYGFSLIVIQLVWAAFIRKFPYGMDIYFNYRQVSASKDESLLRTQAICYEALERICNDPEDSLVVTYASQDEDRESLVDIIELFAGHVRESGASNLLEQAKAAMTEWFRLIPLLTRKKREFKEDHVLPLLKLLQDHDKLANTREFLRLSLIEALGFNAKSFSWRDDRSALIERLKRAKEELSTELTEFRAPLYEELYKLFNTEHSREALEKGMLNWHGGVSMQIGKKDDLPPDVSSFLEEYQEKRTVDELLFYVIPKVMGVTPISQWLNDRTPEVLSWVKKARYLLQFKNLEGFLDTPSQYDDKTSQLSRFVDVLVNNLGLSERDKGEIIEGSIEQLA